MIRRLRQEHRDILTDMQINMHEELRKFFYDSAFSRSWMIDGSLAAMGGVTGTMISPTGMVWLAVSELATRFPVAMTREATHHMRLIMSTRLEVSAVTVWGDERANRFAEYLGFELERDFAGDRRMLWKRKAPALREVA